MIENNYNKFSLYCLNNHKYTDLTINSIIDQKDESTIKCDKCGNNKSYYNKFFIDSKGDKICSLCSEKYKNNIVDYEYRFIMCIKHLSKYISYCKKCNKNLCKICQDEHKKHKIKLFKEMKPNEKKIEELNNEVIKINKYKKRIRKIK